MFACTESIRNRGGLDLGAVVADYRLFAKAGGEGTRPHSSAASAPAHQRSPVRPKSPKRILSRSFYTLAILLVGAKLRRTIDFETEGAKTMDDDTLDPIADEILTYEITDEAIESVACSVREQAGAVTLAFCSGLDTCPS
jgi:hypothetical protein